MLLYIIDLYLQAVVNSMTPIRIRDGIYNIIFT